MKMLNREDVNRWFTLTIDAKSGFPCIRIYNDILTNLETFRPEIIASIRKSLNLGEQDFTYQEKPGDTFGFGSNLRRINSSKGQTTYRLNLPVIHKCTNIACKECSGTKKDEHGSTCLYCSGSGKKNLIVWEEAFALSASVALLMELLEFACEEQRPQQSNEKQILTLNLFVARDMHGGSIGGRFSPYFIDSIKSYGQNAKFNYAAEAMFRVHQYMWKSRNTKSDLNYTKYSIRAWQNLPGNLLLDVPGDACGIHPFPYVQEIPEGEGMEFTCHNVDSPLQQLTLLTGLAAMCDLVG